MSKVAGVGICVPVHNEEEGLPRALRALEESIARITDVSIHCRLAIVLDACTDGSESLVRRWAADCHSRAETLVIECSAQNVGIARQSGFALLVDSWAKTDLSRVWLATTDGDSEVPPDWLTRQLERISRDDVEFWAGRVDVVDWSGRKFATSRRWKDAYRDEAAPVHGASMGLSATLFLELGGCPPLESGEDEALRTAAVKRGSKVCHDWGAPVTTSARSCSRAPLGFGHYLDLIEDTYAAG